MNGGIHELLPVIEIALARGQHVRMVAHGNSMRPFIRNGDEVELEAVGFPPLVGDVVLGRLLPREYVLHRVVQVDGGKVYLRGDAERRREGPFERQDVLARIRFRYRNDCRCPLGEGAVRVAGLLWARTAPLGYCAVRMTDRFRRVGER